MNLSLTGSLAVDFSGKGWLYNVRLSKCIKESPHLIRPRSISRTTEPRKLTTANQVNCYTKYIKETSAGRVTSSVAAFFASA